MNWDGKQVVVLGLGASGMAAALKLADLGAEVTVRDEGTELALAERAETLRRRGVKVELGGGVRAGAAGFDLAVASPGIDPRRPILAGLAAASVPVWGELEFAYRFCECPIVAITGTNGKTTTTELAHAVLAAAGKRTLAAGNIGPALSEVVGRSADLDVLVVEASSFQLEQVIEFKPRVAALLNLTPDHLDRYGTMEAYLRAKLRVFENQDEDDFAVVNASFGDLKLRARTITFSARGLAAEYTLEGGWILRRGRRVIDLSRTRLRGAHNAENAMVAVAVAHLYGLPPAVVTEALGDFRPGAHRLETVAEVGGVVYIDDSKGTNIDAVAVALECQDRPVVLIAGGKDKGFAFDGLAEIVARKARAAVLIGETAPKLEKSWPKVKSVRALSMDDAVNKAAAEARAGDVVLLSPGCSSFDMFRDYRDRGERFRQAVGRLVKEAKA